jgi:glyoxalase family protein
VTLLEHNLSRTEALLNVMGLEKVADENGTIRFASKGEALGRFIDIKVDPSAPSGRMGAGSVHHIAFRNRNDKDQADWQRTLSKFVSVTSVQDRTYFHSIYFREPGGVLFEMATDNPGFLIDEPVESLGEALRVPEWYEPVRRQIATRLSPIELHKAAETSSLGAAQ